MEEISFRWAVWRNRVDYASAFASEDLHPMINPDGNETEEALMRLMRVRKDGVNRCRKEGFRILGELLVGMRREQSHSFIVR